MSRRLNLALLCAVSLLLALASVSLASDALAGMSRGQTVYVPCSSHINHGPKTRQVDLTVTLLVRNADTRRSISVTSVDYHGTDGKLVRRYLSAPLTLGPLSAREFVVDEKDRDGGVGASFLVRWKAEAEVNEPVVEAVMISSTNNLGISFVSQGVAVKE